MRMGRLLALSSVLSVAIANAAVPVAAQVPEAELIATEWLGPRPAAAAEINARRPVFEGPGALFAEQQRAQRTIRAWWPAHVEDAKAGKILDGFAWYLQTRAVERVFDLTFLRTAHSYDTLSYLGGHVIWSVPPLRLSRHAVATRDRYGAVFMSLERWLGTPALQGAMFQVARLPQERLTADDIVTTISDAAGQDISWLFAAADAEISYGVTALTGTSVTVTRKGAGMFTGRAATRAGEFDSGDGVRLKVVFGNGDTTVVTWDGRDRSRTFDFQGPSPVTAAHLDPDRTITLDHNRLDDAIVPAQPTNVPVRKWAARWMVWLQHTMLSYGFLA